MRLFSLLASCLILLLPTSSFAYTTHRTTVGPLSMYFGTPERLAKQETITQFDEPLELTATLENKGDTPLSVKLTFRTIETLEILNANTGGLAPPAHALPAHALPALVTPPAHVELPGKGTVDITVKVAARKGTYTAHYPVRLDAEFPFNGETVTAHIIQVVETDVPLTAPNAAQGAAANINVLPESGGLALATLNNYRVVWNYDNQPAKFLPIGFQGMDSASGASVTRMTADRGNAARQSIGMHPPWRGGIGNVGIEYRMKLPETKPISLSFFSAVRDTMPPEVPSDGVTYRIKVDGKTVYEKHDAETVWVAHEVDLSEFAGQEILLTLESDPGPQRNTNCDSCYWGDVILFAGEKPAALSAEAKQKLFAENLQAIKNASRAGDGAQRSPPTTQVFNLDGGLVGAVTFGNLGLLDGVIGLGNAERQVQFDGLRIQIAREPTMSSVNVHIKQNGPALQFVIDAPEVDCIEFGPATHHAPRIYYGHGYCIVEPEAFNIHADGHNLSTSHVGMDFDNGLSVLQASSLPPDRFIVDPQAKRYTLSVHPATTMTLLPGLKGAFDCAIRFRPLHEAKPSAGVATKAGRFVFDIWGGRYSEHLDIIKHAAKYGLTDSIFIVHAWQHYGYDNRLPDIYPPNSALGTLAEMQEALELCNSLGILYGVHDNYIDIYPDADGYNFDMTTFHANGQPRKAWNNYGIEAQSYQFRPDRFQPFLDRNLDLMLPHLPQSAYFVDVFSSLAPMDYYDREGNFYSRAETLRHWGKAFDTIRDRLSEKNKHFPSAVTISESGLDSLVGHLDGSDCNFMFISPESGEFRLQIRCKEWARVPWYDAVHHTKFSLHGAGYSNRYEAQRGRELHGIESDDYITSEILTGHALMIDHPASKRGAVRKYWLAQDLIRHLADKEIESVEFEDGNIHRQKITWSGRPPTYVWVNLGKSDWVSKHATLPQYGYYAECFDYSAVKDKDIEAMLMLSGIVKEDGRVFEFALSSGGDMMGETVYVNARQKSVEGLLPIVPTIDAFQYLGENRFSAAFKWDAKDSVSQDLCVFVHCVERRQSWHHRPNEAVLGGSFPAVPTSQWSGEVVTDFPMAIPEELPAGRYYLVVGLYDQKGNGRRAKLMGFNTGAERYAVGWINVQRREGAVSDITFEPLDWDETELYERLLPPKKPVQCWFHVTNGAFRIEYDRERATAIITPLPDEPDTEIMVVLAFNILSSPPPTIFKSVKAIDETGRELRDVPFENVPFENVVEAHYLVFTTQSGEFAYRIEWE